MLAFFHTVKSTENSSLKSDISKQKKQNFNTSVKNTNEQIKAESLYFFVTKISCFKK